MPRKHEVQRKPKLRACGAPVRHAARRIFAVALGVLLVGAPAAAHEDYVAGILIDHAWAEPVSRGASTKLRMRIFNESDRRYSLLRVVTPLASVSDIRAQLDDQKVEPLRSMTVPAFSTLDLHTSHIWIELAGLKQSLKEGDSFSATVVFTEGLQVQVSVLVGITDEEEADHLNPHAPHSSAE